jgi:hypothetical protein
MSRLIFDLDSQKLKETAWCWFAGLNPTTGEFVTSPTAANGGSAVVALNVAVRGRKFMLTTIRSGGACHQIV